MHNKFINSSCPSVYGCNPSLRLRKEVWMQYNMHSARKYWENKNYLKYFIMIN